MDGDGGVGVGLNFELDEFFFDLILWFGEGSLLKKKLFVENGLVIGLNLLLLMLEFLLLG